MNGMNGGENESPVVILSVISKVGGGNTGPCVKNSGDRGVIPGSRSQIQIRSNETYLTFSDLGSPAQSVVELSSQTWSPI
jgi:hypothetical protein